MSVGGDLAAAADGAGSGGDSGAPEGAGTRLVRVRVFVDGRVQGVGFRRAPRARLCA